MAASLIALIVIGLLINVIPEFRIISQAALLPFIALWSGVNIVVLLLVCMMSFQAPIRRAEERFKRHERIWVFTPSGRSTGRIEDISLSGAAVVVDAEWISSTRVDQDVRLYIEEVGFVRGKVVRQFKRTIAVHFSLPPSIERDLLIRKLFTTGFNTPEAEVSALSATAAILGSIVTLRGMEVQREEATEAELAPAKLKPESLVIFPKPATARLADIATQRAHAA